MKNARRLGITTVLLVATGSAMAAVYPCYPLQGLTFFSPRSQGVNAAQQWVGWHPYIHMFNEGQNYFTLAANLVYAHSRRPERISQALFGSDCFRVSGSEIKPRGRYDMIADSFGLSTKFQSAIKLRPSIRNALVTVDGFCGLDAMCPGLYFQFHAPAAWTRWHIRVCEDIDCESENEDFPIGYMGPGPDTIPVGATSFKQAMAGCVKFGDMQDPIKHGKISRCPLTEKGLADLLLIAGYDIVCREIGFAGFNFRVTVPTGTRPKAEYLFEPIVGNGRHWGFGVGFVGRGLIWESSGDQEVSLFVELNLTHLFRARQCRSFDLKRRLNAEPPNPCCPCTSGERGACFPCIGTDTNFGSRYLLLKEFDKDGQYTGNLTPVINHTTLPCKVSVDLEAEFLIMLAYNYRCMLFDLGYNGWLRSKEKIKLKATPFCDKRFALKGIQQAWTNFTGDAVDNNTESTATLASETTNQTIGDYPTFPQLPLPSPQSAQDVLQDANPPIYTLPEMLDCRSAASPRLLTHKLFTHLGYAPDPDNCSFAPFFGIGLEVEFEGVNPVYKSEVPYRNTLSQWAIWTRGGIHF